MLIKTNSNTKHRAVHASIGRQYGRYGFDCHLYNNAHKEYRLGDMVKGKRFRGDAKKYHLKHFPNSIASLYMKRTDDESNLDILIDIIKDKIKVTAEDVIILHLRTGDVIDLDHEHSVRDFLLKKNLKYGNGNVYVKNWEQIYNCVRKFPSRNIIIISGSHKDISTTKSCEYIYSIKSMLENNGYSVKLRLGENMDEDFIAMVNAKYFVSAGGGFSDLASKVRQKLNRKDNCN
jgi:hypothetical protein